MCIRDRILGICRGMQALNVFSGGTLYVRVPGHQVKAGDILPVSYTHLDVYKRQVRPVGADCGICREYGIRRNLRTAALFCVPAVEAVTAASGGAGQRGQLLIGGGHAAVRGRTACLLYTSRCV